MGHMNATVALFLLLLINVFVSGENEEMPECREGDVPCYVLTGHRFFDEKKYDEAITWFEKAGNSPHAIDAIAFAYETGQGKVKDHQKAFSMYARPPRWVTRRR